MSSLTTTKICRFSLLFLLLLTATAYAKEGPSNGGGGNTNEIPVNAIRADILKWISEGGAKGLKLPARLPYETYESSMTKILQPHAVVLTVITNQQEKEEEQKQHPDPELIVKVDGKPKMCRGFLSARNNQPQMLCNSDRFKATQPSEQYRLVHHEYAGLAGAEQNVGASSDYELSNQITDYLVPETVLRLAVKKQVTIKESNDSSFFAPGTYAPIRAFVCWFNLKKGAVGDSLEVEYISVPGAYCGVTGRREVYDCSGGHGCVYIDALKKRVYGFDRPDIFGGNLVKTQESTLENGKVVFDSFEYARIAH